MSAFANLSTCRDIGMGVGPIPWTAIAEFADRAKLAPIARRVFEAVINTLDRAILDDERAKARKERG